MDLSDLVPIPKEAEIVKIRSLFTMDVHLTPTKKIALLRAADTRRKWYSLDDQRVCVLCDRVITGRQIRVTTNSQAAYVLHCPTPDCASLPNDWFYHGSACSRTRGAEPIQSVDVDFSSW